MVNMTGLGCLASCEYHPHLKVADSKPCLISCMLIQVMYSSNGLYIDQIYPAGKCGGVHEDREAERSKLA